MWYVDIPLENYSNLVAISININRLIEEIQIWSIVDIGFIELDDAHCRTRIIMLEKKNSYRLSYFKGLKGLIIGRSSGLASIREGLFWAAR
ncbi:hypothetical protein B1F79_05400 [Coxiella-like endosymbiont of Rhipicephalus sanguineus]|nr:hypothetical protein [Coxiella-like endosymbiont of Rhipicephalus sanguineus]